MTLNNVFDRLVEIAAVSNGGARGETVLSSDLLSQDVLYRMQEELSQLLADLANACGPQQVRALETRFPHLFERR